MSTLLRRPFKVIYIETLTNHEIFYPSSGDSPRSYGSNLFTTLNALNQTNNNVADQDKFHVRSLNDISNLGLWIICTLTIVNRERRGDIIQANTARASHLVPRARRQI